MMMQLTQNRIAESRIVALGVLVAALVALAASLLALVVAQPAQAAFPGANGKIVFESFRDGYQEIYKMNPDGTRQRNLTKNAASDVDPDLGVRSL